VAGPGEAGRGVTASGGDAGRGWGLIAGISGRARIREAHVLGQSGSRSKSSRAASQRAPCATHARQRIERSRTPLQNPWQYGAAYGGADGGENARDGAAGGTDREEARRGGPAAEELAQLPHPDLGGKGAARDDTEYFQHVHLRYAVDFAASSAG
jgi:hypothetical protein